MTTIDQAVAANRRYASRFRPPGRPPAPRIALVLCMDARIDPVRALGLPYGTAHIVRNAGGRVEDPLRSLSISQCVLGTREVAIIHHTECGMLQPGDDPVREAVERALGPGAAQGIRFLSFTDLVQSVHGDLAVYRSSPLVRQDIPVRGFVFDVSRGLLEEIGAARA